MTADDILQLNILNPKRKSDNSHNFYPYYAGFSQAFANSIIQSSKLEKKAQIFDPWNGSGTTTIASASLGYNAIGYDLNPVMVIAARANLLDYKEKPSILPLALEIAAKAKRYKANILNNESDPLCIWLIPQSASYFRRLEKALQVLLINHSSYTPIVKLGVSSVSTIASFFYVAFFKTIREILVKYGTSNPTWIKKPDELNQRLRPSLDFVIKTFEKVINELLEDWQSNEWANISNVSIKTASSTKLDIDDSSIDFVLTSPPYCTRIDYAVATMPELAILGYNEDEFTKLRKSLIGTLTVSKKQPEANIAWGLCCNEFLSDVYNHSSKASKSYYYKNHIQYFDSIYNSFCEMSRVLKPGGSAVLVVQDSYYKDVYNNLAVICTEMGSNKNLSLVRQEDFHIRQSMVGINGASKKYRSTTDATESVLCFLKE